MDRIFTEEQIDGMRHFFRRSKTLIIILAVIAGLIALSLLAIHLMTDYIWMDHLQFGEVFTTILYSKASIVVVGFIIFFISLLATLYWIKYTYVNHFHISQLPKLIANKKSFFTFSIIISILFGLFGSSIVQNLGWEPLLKFLNRTSFGITDPYFQLDVSFYEFTLPFIHFSLYTAFVLSGLMLLVVISAYSVFRIYRMSRHAQIHLSIYVFIFTCFIAAIHYFGKYETLLTDQVNMMQKSVVHGLSYTDHMVNIPKAYVLAIAALLIGVWAMIILFRGKIEKIVLPLIIYGVLIVGGQGVSMAVQNFIVSPNEFAKESPYLEHNLAYTRMAYELDDIKEEMNPAEATLDEQMLERNELTMNNVRVNDARPLKDIYNQLQTIRTYYQFNDMDIDRYKVNGKYEQVFIGARELITDDLPQQSQTWVNRNLRYTHGYGVAMSHVNKVTSQGQPEYMLKNLPVEGDIEVTRPQIYFGEEPYPNVIVNSKVDEFDYPSGEKNMTNRYSEDVGIPLVGWNRVLFAIKERSIRMLVTNQLTDESKLLMTRNIKERVERIAPFLTYDDDPYIMIREDGTLGWIIDAYIIGEHFPYAEGFGAGNYVRNAIKVFVDAYTGEVNFYVVDETDPIVQTYEKMFPTLFTYDIPEDIFEHFRYPVDLFAIQARMYGTYHMSDLEVFYNREDYWQFATEKFMKDDIEVEPYYITMKLPEAETEEFILMIPYTPKNRQNLIAWMGVRNDGDHYGEIFVQRFPKQKNVYGPQQIDNRINQDSYISQQINLWSTGSSEVIRGNLLVIPMEDTVLYVEPIYIESSNETSLPEVKQVIVAYEDYIVMEETFEKALDQLLLLIDSGFVPEEDGADDLEDNEDNESNPIIHAEEILSTIASLFDEYEKEMAKGNYGAAGAIMEEIEKLIRSVR